MLCVKIRRSRLRAACIFRHRPKGISDVRLATCKCMVFGVGPEIRMWKRSAAIQVAPPDSVIVKRNEMFLRSLAFGRSPGMSPPTHTPPRSIASLFAPCFRDPPLKARAGRYPAPVLKGSFQRRRHSAFKGCRNSSTALLWTAMPIKGRTGTPSTNSIYKLT